jgi:hypothetical protein
MIWQQGRAAMQPTNHTHSPMPDIPPSHVCSIPICAYRLSALMSGCMTGISSRRMQPEIIIKMQRRPILCVCAADI